MERTVEWYALVTSVVVGLSHILQPRAWAEAFAALHRLGKPGAFANGSVNLVHGAVFVAAHPVWSGPAVILTLLGWALVLKGAINFLAPSWPCGAWPRPGRSGATSSRRGGWCYWRSPASWVTHSGSVEVAGVTGEVTSEAAAPRGT